MMNILTKHLNENKMSYIQHFKVAIRYSFWFFLLSIVGLLHAIFPFIFEKTITNRLSYLVGESIEKSDKNP